MKPADVESRWEFYPCIVDDAPASISLNLWFESNRPPSGVDTLYAVGFQILEPGDHGMGVGEDVAQLHALGDAVVHHAIRMGLYYVGRVRNNGDWQLTFYGTAGMEAPLEQAIIDEPARSGRGYRTVSRQDPSWRYYEQFLLPNAERRQWISNRRVVEALKSQGDTLERTRRVDHWIYFETAEGRNAFVAAVRLCGFATVDQVDDGADITAQVFRSEVVELDAIHSTVMRLDTLAKAHGGDYDGWETSVEQA